MNRRQSGFSIVTAIFLLVALALLGAFMLSLSGTQQVTTAQDVQGSQAYRAARTGMDWAIAEVKATAACPTATPPTVEGYAVAVACTSNSYDEAGTTRKVYWMESTASRGGAVGGIGYVERRVSAFVEFPS